MPDIATCTAKHNPITPAPDVGDVGDLPVGFEPRRYPIIAEHWFNWRPIGVITAQVVQDLKYRRKIQRLVAKGERVVGEMLAELAADRNLGTVIDRLLDRYIDIDDAALDAIGACDFPPAPLHTVEQ